MGEKTNRHIAARRLGWRQRNPDRFKERSDVRPIAGKRIAILVANEGVEQVELTSPLAAVREAGAEVELLAPEGDEIQAFNHLDKGESGIHTQG